MTIHEGWLHFVPPRVLVHAEHVCGSAWSSLSSSPMTGKWTGGDGGGVGSHHTLAPRGARFTCTDPWAKFWRNSSWIASIAVKKRLDLKSHNFIENWKTKWDWFLHCWIIFQFSNSSSVRMALTWRSSRSQEIGISKLFGPEGDCTLRGGACLLCSPAPPCADSGAPPCADSGACLQEGLVGLARWRAADRGRKGGQGHAAAALCKAWKPGAPALGQVQGQSSGRCCRCGDSRSGCRGRGDK